MKPSASICGPGPPQGYYGDPSVGRPWERRGGGDPWADGQHWQVETPPPLAVMRCSWATVMGVASLCQSLASEGANGAKDSPPGRLRRSQESKPRRRCRGEQQGTSGSRGQGTWAASIINLKGAAYLVRDRYGRVCSTLDPTTAASAQIQSQTVNVRYPNHRPLSSSALTLLYLT